MSIIGATTFAAGSIGLVVNVGGNLYMVTGRPSTIEKVAGQLTLYADVLARRPGLEDDALLDHSTMVLDGEQESITGPYNALMAIRDILLAKAA